MPDEQVPLAINCPTGPLTPGATVVIAGTTPDAAATTHSESFNGAALTTTYTGSGTDVKWEFVVPACEAGKPNIVVLTIKHGADVATCSVRVNCP